MIQIAITVSDVGEIDYTIDYGGLPIPEDANAPLKIIAALEIVHKSELDRWQPNAKPTRKAAKKGPK
jgi:hypothetical protein